MLNNNQLQKFLQILITISASSSYEGRESFLVGIPQNIVLSLNRSNNARVDLTNIIRALDGLGRINNTGARPLIILANNALMDVKGTEIGNKLEEIIRELEEYYGVDEPSETLLPIPEILIFTGKDERLPFSFIELAAVVSRSVARLKVPYIVNGVIDNKIYGYGTGWIIAPNLILTNYHVINNRRSSEPSATMVDLHSQAQNSIAWFDYHIEGRTYIESNCIELVHCNSNLDYALIKMKEEIVTTSRTPLSIIKTPPQLCKGDRLNIVQYPGGGPLRYAIRNNFYSTGGETPDHIRYLTDTEFGSSGSPILNDSWRVVGMHHAYFPIPEEVFKGDTIKFLNQGILVHSILADLPVNIRLEIEKAQGWI